MNTRSLCRAARPVWGGVASLPCRRQASIAHTTGSRRLRSPRSGLPIRADTVDGFGGEKDARSWFRFLHLRRGARDAWRKASYFVTMDYTSKRRNISERYPGARRNDARSIVAALPRPIRFGVCHIYGTTTRPVGRSRTIVV
jgi:hypothetical protein